MSLDPRQRVRSLQINRNHRLHGLPSVRWHAPDDIKLKPASSATGALIEPAVYPVTSQSAEEQGSDTAVPHKQHIAVVEFREAGINFPHDPLLRIRGSFPTAGAFVGVGKELICDPLELVSRQISGGASVVFAHLGTRDHGHAQRGRQRLSRL